MRKGYPSGLKDKNGRMICNGDKTKEWLVDTVLDEGGSWNYGKVKFCNGAFYWFEKGYDYERTGAQGPMLLSEVNKEIEVL